MTVSSRRPNLSLPMCALAFVGCGVGITLLKQAPPTLPGDYYYASIHRRRQATNPAGSWSSSSYPPPPPLPLHLDDLDATSTTSDGGAAAASARNGSMTTTGGGAEDPANPADATPERSNRPVRNDFYTVARIDRAGASINHMMIALGHGYANNLTYMGACHQRPVSAQRQADKETLIRVVGLQNTLKFACPPDNRTDLILTDQWDRMELFTPEFISWLRSKATPIPHAPNGLAVVHVRRGDVDPCQHLRGRYLPVSYYVDVVNRYVPSNLPVVVFSESASFEPFGDFDALRNNGTRNVTVRLDTDVSEVWTAIMASSHFVMSRSSFTYLPAILNVKATILYPPKCGQRRMPEWTRVQDDIWMRSDRQVEALVERGCHNFTSVRAG